MPVPQFQNPFKVGDVVQLKSGGAAMTVIETKINEVTCTWHDMNWTSLTAIYPHQCLIHRSED